MAAVSVNVGDMREAITNGTIPGLFTADHTRFEFPPLSYTNARGALRTWAVAVTLLRGPADPPGNSLTAAGLEPVAIADEMLAPAAVLPPGLIAEVRVESRQAGGKLRDVVPTYVHEGKNVGKKNATNALSQALRDALGLYNKHLRASGAAAPDAAAGPVALRPPPQLLKAAAEAPLTEADFRAGVTVQPKLNGLRFVAYAVPGDGGKLSVARYSRTGLDYPGQEIIAGELAAMFAAARAGVHADDTRADALYLDGELYRHGEGLNQISGQGRRADAAGDPELSLFVFDAFMPAEIAAGRDRPSRDRQALLDAFFAAADAAGVAHPHVARVPNHPVADQAAVDTLAREFLAAGYEGAVARRDLAGYRYGTNGYHSANAVKIKPTHDAEFPVVGYGQGGRGKEVGAVLWVCEVPADRALDLADRTFTVVPKNMTYAERYAVYRCLGANVAPAGAPPQTRFERDVRGLPLTVEYKELSLTTGKPLQAKALAFRTYESGPSADPIARLLRECDAP
jgi:hypothetical protein